MKKDKFDTAIDGINEDLIAEAANIIPKRKHLHITRYASAVAACAVFAVGVALVKNYAATSPELLKFEELNSGVLESQDTNSYSDQFTSESDNEGNVLNNASDFQSVTEKRNDHSEKTVGNQQFNEDKAASGINAFDSAMNENGNDNDCNSDAVIHNQTTSDVEISDSAIDVNDNHNDNNSDTNVSDETPSAVVNAEPTINTNGNDNGSTPDTSVPDNDICDRLWSITVNGKTYVENRAVTSGFTPNQYLGTVAEFDGVSGPYDTYNAANEVYTTVESETVLLIKLSSGKIVVLSLLF